MMADTQWPRYMVFQGHEPGDDLVHNGTVHAPDAEMALLTARDVFSRRPRAVSMWVVPADEIFSITHEELQNEKLQIANGDNDSKSQEAYHVFGKTYEQGQCEQFGEVDAVSHEDAMKKAIETFKHKKALWWWAFPARAVLSSTDSDTDSMFAPVLDKHYRDQAQFPVMTMMRAVRAKRKGEVKDG
ncbi:MAG: phenylacetic acid degradation protein [Chloroflexi bacterium]|nr:phenylacetic acid degradation protein [Chloroflexota bacterium]